MSAHCGANIDGSYRYGLWRHWDLSKGTVCWIMLNPSTADATTDDATIRRCIGFAKLWGYGGIEVVNLYAYRSTLPSGLLTTADPIGERNDVYLKELVNRDQVSLVVAAWGNNVISGNRIRDVMGMIQKPVMCLGETKSGQPKHPVRLSYETALIPYRLAADPERKDA